MRDLAESQQKHPDQAEQNQGGQEAQNDFFVFGDRKGHNRTTGLIAPKIIFREFGIPRRSVGGKPQGNQPVDRSLEIFQTMRMDDILTAEKPCATCCVVSIMKILTKILTTAAALAVLGAVAIGAVAEVGHTAPDFTLTDINGNKHSLSDFKGKTVILEWVNPECPFVMKHYDKSGNIPKTQQAATADGVVWLSINSAAPGNDGDYDVAHAKAWQARIHSAATAYLRDQDGKVGKLYDARTTPHLYVIDAKGTLVYAGGIDNIRSARVEDIAKATNYVNETLADLKAGKTVRTTHSQPYGCSVKY
jgi:hypothetical protein